MQQRAGLLFLSTSTKRILLILENQLWTVPTFERHATLLEDASHLFDLYSKGKVLPIELYTSEDRGFEYGTYVCVVKEDFSVKYNITYSWCKIDAAPKNLHSGLKFTLNNSGTKTKLETIMELANELVKEQ
jgi:hypothetical protein